MLVPNLKCSVERFVGVSWLCALLLALGACSREKSASSAKTPVGVEPGGPVPVADLKPVNPDDPPQAQEKARLAAVMAMRQGSPPPPPPALRLRGGELATPEVLAAYNQELLRVRILQRESPESLDALVQKWIRQWRWLPPLPTPPPGKRIVYDDVNCIIRLDPP
jgi:hypothetical protein